MRANYGSGVCSARCQAILLERGREAKRANQRSASVLARAFEAQRLQLGCRGTLNARTLCHTRRSSKWGSWLLPTRLATLSRCGLLEADEGWAPARRTRSAPRRQHRKTGKSHAPTGTGTNPPSPNRRTAAREIRDRASTRAQPTVQKSKAN